MKKLHKLIFSAVFLALAFVLPFLTGQIANVGAMLCPMHIPVILCGFLCSWKWGLAVGFIAPLLRSFTLGMPPMFPTALAMAFELATYGAIAGCAYAMLPKKKLYVYPSLVISMIAGRIIWGIVTFACVSFSGGEFGLSAFVSGAVLNAIPGIILQLAIIPPIVMLLKNTKIFK